MNVGETFLEHPEQHQLRISLGTLHILRKIIRNLNPAALGEAFDKPARRGSKAYFIEQGWVEQVRCCSYRLQGFVQKSVEVIQRARDFRYSRRKPFEHCQSHLQCRKRLPGCVVEVAGYATTLLVLKCHKSNRQTAKSLLRLFAYFYF